MGRRMNQDHFFTPYTKINSKWMKDLNIIQEVIKILEEKTGNNFFDFGHSNFLLDMSPEATETKAKMNYWDLIKIKSFCTAKETISKTKRQPMEWENNMLFANNISDKGVVSKIYKELFKLNTQKTNNPVKKTGNNLFDLSHSIFLLDTSPEAWETKAKMNYWDHIKIKIFCIA